MRDVFALIFGAMCALSEASTGESRCVGTKKKKLKRKSSDFVLEQ